MVPRLICSEPPLTRFAPQERLDRWASGVIAWPVLGAPLVAVGAGFAAGCPGSRVAGVHREAHARQGAHGREAGRALPDSFEPSAGDG